MDSFGRGIALTALAVSVGGGLGCSASAVVGLTDGGSGPDAGTAGDGGTPRDAGPTLPVDGSTLDIDTCEAAPRLGLDTRIVNLQPDRLGPPPEGRCFSGDGPRGYFGLTLPAHTGVWIDTRAEGAAAPVVGVADRCGPQEACEYFGANGSFGGQDVERSYYLGNPTDAPWELIVSLWWGQGWATPPFELTTHSVALGPEAACESAPVLDPGVLVPEGPGGFFRACGNAENPRFYLAEVPAMSRIVPLPESGAPWGLASCTCGRVDDLFFISLENLGDQTRAVRLKTVGAAGFEIEAMPPSARCEGAPELTLDGAPLAVEHERGGEQVLACDRVYIDEKGAHYAWVRAPAGRTIRVRAHFPDAGAEQGTELWARDGCGRVTCEAQVSSSLGAPTTALELTAPPDAEGRWVVGLGLTALPAPDQVGLLSASLVP